MEPCKHPLFTVATEVKVHRDEIENEPDPAKRFIFRGRTIEIKVVCAECRTPMKFVAPNVMFSLKGLNICRNETVPEDCLLICPIEPASVEPVLVEPRVEKPILKVLPKPEPPVSPTLASHIANWFGKKGVK